MRPPRGGGELWGFNEEADEDNFSFDEDEENTAGIKPILKVSNNIIRRLNIILLDFINC